MNGTNGTYIQRFTFVDLSELRLAGVACLVQGCLGHFEQLHTEPLPAPHVPDGTLMRKPTKKLDVSIRELPIGVILGTL